MSDLLAVATGRADKLRKMATESDAIRWKVSAVLRENASLILTLAQRIAVLEAEIRQSRPVRGSEDAQ